MLVAFTCLQHSQYWVLSATVCSIPMSISKKYSRYARNTVHVEKIATPIGIRQKHAILYVGWVNIAEWTITLLTCFSFSFIAARASAQNVFYISGVASIGQHMVMEGKLCFQSIPVLLIESRQRKKVT
jgi:hypothetical protein